MYVTVGDFDPTPWAGARGLARETARGWTKWSEFTVERFRDDRNVNSIVEFTQHVGRELLVTEAHMNRNDGTQTDAGLQISARLERVELADYNANANGVAVDRLILRPVTVKAMSKGAS
jgi:hypothetical protein